MSYRPLEKELATVLSSKMPSELLEKVAQRAAMPAADDVELDGLRMLQANIDLLADMQGRLRFSIRELSSVSRTRLGLKSAL